MWFRRVFFLLLSQHVLGALARAGAGSILDLLADAAWKPSNQSASRAPFPDPWLERKLRQLWGNASYRFSELEQHILEDRTDLGFERRTGLDERVVATLWKVVEKYELGGPCSSLPLELELHAWRYKEEDLDRCLSADFWSSGNTTCYLRCASMPSERAELHCQASQGSAELTGRAPAGRCVWTPDEALVNTTGGLVRGLVRPIPWRWADGRVSSERTRTFWGVPYADRPGRFEMARPLSRRWPGVHVTDYFNLTENSSLRMHCVGAAPLDSGNGTEDCLFLDIYCPPNASAASPRPVVVLFFAAGFINGNAWLGGLTDGVRIALRDDVVFVMVSSRQAALGHWAHPALTAEYGDGSAGNIGERDQRMALRWVQENIGGFGGDPDKVTLMGHSSGAFDIAFHLLSPGSEGLFAGAVLESASFDSGWYWQNKEDVFTFYAQLGEAMGCPQDGGDGAQIRCLRALPADAFFNFSKVQENLMQERAEEVSYFTDIWQVLKSILAAEAGIGGGFHKAGLVKGDSKILASPLWPSLPYGLVVDGSDAGMPAPPREIFEAGRGADVPVYVNHETDEGTVFAISLASQFPWQKSFSFTHDAVDAMLHWVFSENATFAKELVERYPRDTGLTPFARLSNTITDSVFKCSARRFAAARSRRRPGSVFWAEHTFSVGYSTSRSAAEALLRADVVWFLGANHLLPTPQIFGAATSTLWEDIDQQHHQLLHCHFARMFHCGNPGAAAGAACRQSLAAAGVMPLACKGVPEDAADPFEAFDPATQKRKQLSPTNHTPIVPSADETALCGFWDSAPPMRFQHNACRGCGRAAGPAPASWEVAAALPSELLV